MSNRTFRPALVAAALSLCVLLSGCPEARDPVDRTQAGAILKSTLDGEFFFQRTVIDTPYETEFTFIGDQGELAFGFIEPEEWRSIVAYTKNTADICLAIAMAAVGLGTSIAALKCIGMKPLAVGLFSAVLVGAVSASLITLLY